MAVRGQGALTRWAGAAPVPVHVAVGHGGDGILAGLRADDRVEVVTTPRHATVLVVAGQVPTAARDALRATHDQVPAPRATVVVGSGDGDVGLPRAVSVGPGELVDGIVAVHRDLLAGGRSDPVVGPHDNPVEWQGVGPHGQGGEGMMGGVPWGRPMPMPPVEGRDGLALDRLSLRLGPFLAGLPPLVELDVGLQGDVLEAAAVDVVAPDPGMAAAGVHRRGGATCELVALAELVALVGLEGLAVRIARTATGSPGGARVRDLRRRLDRRLGLRAATDGVGRLGLPGLSGDVTARWRRWLDRADAAAAGQALPVAEVLDPAELGDALVGMEVGAALLTLASVRPQLIATAQAGVAA